MVLEASSLQVINIALLGFGNIGTGVYRLIEKRRQNILEKEGYLLQIKRILVRDVNRKREYLEDISLLTNNPDDIFNDPDISVVAEFMGGESPAAELLVKALNSGKSVVTANKEVVAKRWEELDRAARGTGAGLYYEASTGGVIPVIRTIQESLQANRISRVMGIINGTTNYILTKMSEQQISFSDALREAQELGYAEPDPTADVEGYDARFKLSILSTLCFHKRVHVENILCEGITTITSDDIAYGRELGFGIKLLGIAKDTDGKVEVRVHPTFIPLHHPLASVRGSFNAIFLSGDACDDMMLYGRGAGDMPTASAIVSDILAAVKNKGKHRYLDFQEKTPSAACNEDWNTEYYIRLTVKDQPGVLGEIAGIFGKYNVSIASVIQKGRGGQTAPLIFVTHEAAEQSVTKAIGEIGKSPFVVGVDNLIRVER